MEKDIIWKDVIGYEGYYKISNTGVLISLARHGVAFDKVMKGELMKKGYIRHILSGDNKKCKIMAHRIVAQAFIKNPFYLPQVNHINEVKTDNYVSNLEWCTNVYNKNHGTGIERQAETMINHPSLSMKINQFDLEGNFIKEWQSQNEIERTLGFGKYYIRLCLSGKIDSYGGFKWIKLQY